MPKISVLMGIYNCGDKLEQAVESVVKQSFTDWELIMCDDGSTDNTRAVALALAEKDSRIRVIENNGNKGLSYTLNRCAKEAGASILARMDGDDICDPSRFEKEYNIISSENFDIVSCGMLFFDENGVYGKKLYKQYPEKSDFAGNSPFCHAGAMIKKEPFLAAGGYCEDKSRDRIEDFDLWFRMYKNGSKGFNIGEYLYSMRDDRNAVKRKKYKFRINEYKLKKQIAAEFDFGIKGQIKALRPLILGLCPSFIYRFLHKQKLGGEK